MTVKKNEKLAVLYLIGLLVCIFCLTMLLLIQGVSNYVYLAIILLTVMQAAGLIWYLQEDHPPENRLFRWLLRLNLASSVGTVIFAVYLYLTMVSQFHAVLTPDASGDISDLDMTAVENAENCYVFETDQLYILFPQYEKISYVFKDRPSMDDPDITLFGTSAFFRFYELNFRHDCVVGDHAKDGIYYEGADEANLSAFTFYDGGPHFSLTEADEAVRIAAENGGDGFEQYMAIWQGEKQDLLFGKLRCYRLLAELNGRICFIESSVPMHYDDFIDRVLALGVKNALYMDMGAKCSYSQYRNEAGKAVNLFGKPGEFVHSWVVFYK